MPSAEKKKIVGLGELLWDLFAHGMQLGGAPANFAYSANLLGDIGIAASRVGRDPRGEEALAHLQRHGLETGFVQRDAARPTGTVNVTVDARGEPAFQITEPVAWDFLEWEPSWQRLSQSADAVCFGSLAQRSPQSRETIHAFLAAMRPAAARIFDVNLRQAFYSAEILRDSLSLADIVKLNHEELPRVAELLGLQHDGSMESQARKLLETFNLKMLCVTRGASGSLSMTQAEVHEHPGFPARVVDTVGAGDAFTAALIHYYLRGSPLAAMNEAANRMGAWVASKAGAMPPAEAGILARIRAAS
jgi:fructokinase